MIHGMHGVLPPGLWRTQPYVVQGNNDKPLPDTAVAQTTEKSGPIKVQDFGAAVQDAHNCCCSHRCGGDDGDDDDHGPQRRRFHDAVGAAAFDWRQRMERRADFRDQMHEIRSDIRSLMDEVDGGQLTADQQQTFDGLVDKIAELRDTYHFKHWRSADPEVIGARILDRFGVLPAAEGTTDTTGTTETIGTTETPAVDPVVANVETTDTGESVGSTSGTGGTADPASTETSIVQETSAGEPATTTTAGTETNGSDAAGTTTEPAAPAATTQPADGTGDAPDLAALADKLASIIADASSAMDELLQAIGA